MEIALPHAGVLLHDLTPKESEAIQLANFLKKAVIGLAVVL
jgi:hypothetical protein